MRYVPMSLVEDGMVLGQDIYDGGGRMLLARHLILNPAYIRSLDEMGFPGIYIDDEFSEDIEIKEIIRPEVKREALGMISTLFMEGGENRVSEAAMNRMAKMVVEQVLDNGDAMCNMLDIKKYDDYTYFHSVNVGILATMVGCAMRFSQEQLRDLALAAMLHDIGKRFIPVEVLNKEEELGEEEKAVLRTHPKQGADFLRDKFNFSVYVNQGVMQHHEWYNGHGYPLGRMKEEIPIFARIIALVDVYDALTTNRMYRPAISNSEAVEYLMGSSGRQFDPEILDVFLHKIAIYPVGAQVRLSDGSQAVVMKNYTEMVLRPKIKQMGTSRIIDLAYDPDARNLTIVDMIMR